MLPQTSINELFGIRYPIVLAPMAGVTNPALAAAVAKAGGLGSHGCAMLTAKTLRADIREFRKLAGEGHKFNANFFVHERPSRNGSEETRVKGMLQPFYDRLDAGQTPDPSEVFLPYSDELHAVVMEEKVEIVSFHFGLPSDDKLAELKASGCLILSSATNVEEAKWLEARGVDAIIAQSWEAGGHRGTFIGAAENGSVGAISLIPQIVDAVSTPVIAAGGITDGRAALAALVLGASAVQVGTAFLLCPEANVSEPHRHALKTASAHDTRVTRAFSGRPARSLRNDYLDEFARQDEELLPFPLMNSLSGPLKTASLKAGHGEAMPLWSGQSAPMISEKSAAEIVANLVEDIEQQLKNWQI
jgi:nitronate monooxygenase